MSTSSSFALDISLASRARVLRVSGRLVVGVGATSPAWEATGALGDGERVVVDLTAVPAIDAGGIGCLLRVRQTLARRGVRLTISAAAPRVRRVLHLTGLDAVFGIASGDAPLGGSPGPPNAAAVLSRCA